MKIGQMRHEIAKVYKSTWWQKKVEKMNENQVIAIYYRFLANGKLKAPPKAYGFSPAVIIADEYHQISFDDILNDRKVNQAYNEDLLKKEEFE